MTSTRTIHDLLKALSGLETFEAAADRLLTELVEGRLHPPPSRGWVHLRDATSYRGVVGRTRRGARLGDDAPSWTTGREALASGRSVVLDVETAVLRAIGESEATRARRPSAEFRSRDHLLARRVCTVVAVPFMALGGAPAGFVSLEWTEAPSAVPFAADATPIELLVVAAAPYVTGLPRRPRLVSVDPDLPVVGEAIQPLLDDLRCFARSPDKILLTGETGVGKSYLARWCHAQSPRRDRPFERYVVRGDSAQMQAGDLFGWRRGAFTGADEDRAGLVERANGGTLFIDEIDKLGPDGQTVLLGLLDDGCFRRLGENKTRQADVRFIIGTNADLRAEVEAGRFLPDLYYRVAELPQHVPPLRERRDEIGDWAEVFARQADARLGNNEAATIIDPAARAELLTYPWPGNLRELGNVMKRACALVDRGQGRAPIITGALIRRAFGPERCPPDRLVEAMRSAASAFVDVALERADGLSITHTNAFKGLVLDVGAERVGEREFFARVEPNQLKSSNHRKVLERERGHIAALADALSLGPSTD